MLDRSGSMEGWKIVAARRAVARMIDTLHDCDRFCVIAFDSVIESPPGLAGGLSAATDHNRFRAVEYLAGIGARGGTEMAGPLERAVDVLAECSAEEQDRVLVLITDGQVGNEDQILATLGRKLKGIRVFTLGIDRAVNEGFLRRLAERGGGACELVESEERLDEVMQSIHRRIGTPLLTGLYLEAEGIAIEPGEVVPRRLPDLFSGSPLLILGRYRGRSGGIADDPCDGRQRAGVVRERGRPPSATTRRSRRRGLAGRFASSRIATPPATATAPRSNGPSSPSRSSFRSSAASRRMSRSTARRRSIAVAHCTRWSSRSRCRRGGQAADWRVRALARLRAASAPACA